MYACIHVHKHVRMRVCTYTCTYIICMHWNVYIRIYVCMYRCIYLCVVYVCRYLYLYTFLLYACIYIIFNSSTCVHFLYSFLFIKFHHQYTVNNECIIYTCIRTYMCSYTSAILSIAYINILHTEGS